MTARQQLSVTDIEQSTTGGRTFSWTSCLCSVDLAAAEAAAYSTDSLAYLLSLQTAVRSTNLQLLSTHADRQGVD